MLWISEPEPTKQRVFGLTRHRRPTKGAGGLIPPHFVLAIGRINHDHNSGFLTTPYTRRFYNARMGPGHTVRKGVLTTQFVRIPD